MFASAASSLLCRNFPENWGIKKAANGENMEIFFSKHAHIRCSSMKFKRATTIKKKHSSNGRWGKYSSIVCMAYTAWTDSYHSMFIYISNNRNTQKNMKDMIFIKKLVICILGEALRGPYSLPFRKSSLNLIRKKIKLRFFALFSQKNKIQKKFLGLKNV